MIATASVALIVVFFLARGQNRKASRRNPRTRAGLVANVIGLLLALLALGVLVWWAFLAFSWLFSPAGWQAAVWVTNQY